MSTPVHLVAGASGVVGLAAARRLAADGTRVLAVSRRAPRHLGAAEHHRLDLADASACRAFGHDHHEVTHLVYAAVQEAPGLAPGWTDPVQIAANEAMLTNLLDALLLHGVLRHVTLLQGTKAYGVHVDTEVPIPCREDSPRHPHPNFYFAQEDALRARASVHGLTFTILRPQIVFGDALGSNMNPLVALALYGALLAAEGRPLHYPGGPRHVSEAADAELVADAIAWCGHEPAARDQIFNVANGDVFVWRDLWPAIAATLDVPRGDDVPMSLVDFFSTRHRAWAGLVARHHLDAPTDLDDALGQSAIYADMLLGVHGSRPGPPALVSTVKLRQAGFARCVDTEAMVVRLLRTLQERRVVPVR